jgi:hypothetical protein
MTGCELFLLTNFKALDAKSVTLFSFIELVYDSKMGVSCLVIKDAFKWIICNAKKV